MKDKILQVMIARLEKICKPEQMSENKWVRASAIIGMSHIADIGMSLSKTDLDPVDSSSALIELIKDGDVRRITGDYGDFMVPECYASQMEEDVIEFCVPGYRRR